MILSFLLLPILIIASDLIVQTSYGYLEGSPIQSVYNKSCWIFKGVPFAQPPTGNRRFKLPIPPKPWRGVKSAKQYSAACMSNSTMTTSPQQNISEDCLYINIFTSEKCMSNPGSCPVVFYIHGGALNYDSAVMFDDQYITDRYSSKDIVFVISAFRLGFFGVLAFENDYVVPRNLALYDIIVGLEFVHQEISNFGGDHHQVTLMGHSQGGSIALLFAVSSLVDPEKRLFQQLIALSPAVNYRNGAGRADLTWRVAYEVGCVPSKDRPSSTTAAETEAIVECLRSVDAYVLLQKQRMLEENEGLLFDGVLFAPPLVEDKTNFKNFTVNCIARPMICSSTRYEFNFQNDDIYDIGAFLMVEHPAEIRKKYFEDKKSRKVSDSYLSQVVFTLNAMFSFLFTRKGSNVYLMQYDQGPFPMHSFDMPHFIGTHMRSFDINDKIIDEFYEKSFVNFINGREPNADWRSFNAQKRNYYSVVADLKRRLLPSNRFDYHSSVVDYWLHNITDYDASLSKL
ncbi:unnamed protein product [Cylicocyclus nassatus]|uniref:Carboxylesterase type B domain-containing protein n=1 Tax=Cylicocyclus nassatus TaxID=53992 RepID=A0AA36MG85_CYLNA|nr:unnamed protein product [Cylicocyclus nassatus]